ncbi:hypothetical protein [Cellvibrio mixtus]|uniref:hypothetical protein n=1 Tax=Cellvibrio mixtus TaxID=39650 RepID=UPI0013640FD4|nr:hypothetical protein [Cellvibrio mixtus]
MISQELNLININMRQPFHDVLAAVTGLTSQNAALLPATQKINELKCTVAAFERSFFAAIYELNTNYFTDVAALRLERSIAGFTETLQNIFGGHVISGISRPAEADFIRNRGGIMVHVKHGEGWPDFHPLSTNATDIIVDSNTLNLNDRKAIADLMKKIDTANKEAA